MKATLRQLLIGAGLLLLACSANVSALAAVTISVSPVTASMKAGAKKTFTATVQGTTNTSVTWQVNGVTGGNSTNGTISTSGVYAAPATVASQYVVTITAVSKADPTKSASAQVTLTVPSISISPTAVTLAANATQKFTATVKNASSSSVIWQVNGITGGNSSLGTVSTSGSYKAPSSIGVQTLVTVSAVLKIDTTKSASAQVTLVPPQSLSITVSPLSASLIGGASQLFTATVKNATNTSVTWQVNDITGGNSTVGTISTSGNYRAPSRIPTLTTVVIKATSVQDTTKSATAQVTLNPVVVSISPPSTTLFAGGQQQFTATVQNAGSSLVTWLVNGVSGGNSTVGTVSGSGVYTAPSTVATQTVVSVTARSQSDTTKSDSAAVTLMPAAPSVTVSVDPPVTSLIGGGTQPFIATVQNASDTGVSWSVNDIAGGNLTIGTISTSGVYAAPAVIPAQVVVTVKAISQFDPSKYGAAEMTLKPVSVSILPGPVSLAGGGTQPFSASVLNASSPDVKWYVNEVEGGDLATVGSISAAGVYEAPAAIPATTTVAIKAISQADTNKFATVVVTLNAISVTVNPGSITLGAGGTQTFSAAVLNTNDSSVSWYVNGIAGGDAANGTISSGGLYTAPASIAAQLTVEVKGISSADSSKSAAATVTLKPIDISVTPNPTTLGGGATQTFVASVLYTPNTDVTWYVNEILGGDPNTVGSISDAGLYTAPSSVTSQSVVTIKATSKADNSKSATAQLTLSPVKVSVSPNTATVNISKTKQFTVTVQYSSDPGVTWQVNGVEGGDDTNGHISLDGLYTAPGAVPNSATVTVTAISQIDPAQSDSAQVTISGATGNSYYVSTTGNDTALGTLTAPWKTISRAAAASSGVKAGDTVYVRGGIYKESVTVAVSGSSLDGPITFQSYPGETAILDGTGLSVPTDPHGMFHLDSRSYITISGFEIRNYQTSSSSAIPAGIWITGSGSNIQILNNLVHDIKTSSEANGQAYGISVYGTGSTAPLDTITIDGNQVYNLKTGGSESVNVDGNVSNFVITNNLIHDNDNIAIDAIGFEGVSSNAALDYARNGIISGNTIYNISGINNPGEGNDYDADGVYVDGGSQILIERNLIHHVDIGIEAAAEHKGKTSSYVTIRNNVIYASNSIGITIGGYDSRRGGTDHCTIVNNTLYGNDTKNTGSGEFQIQYYATNNVFKNNIVYATSQGILVNSYTNSSANPVDLDYNLYFSPLASTAAKFEWNGTARTGFATFQSATGKDAHSRYLNPLFLNLAAFDLRVQPTSPAVDVGIDLTPDINGTTDLSGNPRIQGATIDIGAYEQ